MPNVSYETRVLSVELVARVADISEETAKRIEDFINAEIGKTNVLETEESRRSQLIRSIAEGNGINHKVWRVESAVLGMLCLHPEYIERNPDGKKVSADDFVTELGKKFCKFIDGRKKKTAPIYLTSFEVAFHFSDEEANKLLRWKETRSELVCNDESSFDLHVRALREESVKKRDELTLDEVLKARRNGTVEQLGEKSLQGFGTTQMSNSDTKNENGSFEKLNETASPEEKPAEKDEVAEDHESLANKKERVKNACAPWMWELADKFFQMFERAEENPDAVKNKWITAHDIGKKLFDGEYDAYLIGNVLGHCFRSGAVQRRKKNGATGANEYLIPIPKSEPAKEPEETATEQEVAAPEISVEETPKPATVAARLREYRERSGLGTDEVSELIGYPESVVKAWEAGTNVPSREGKGQIEALFGKHIFDGVQKPVIW